MSVCVTLQFTVLASVPSQVSNNVVHYIVCATWECTLRGALCLVLAKWHFVPIFWNDIWMKSHLLIWADKLWVLWKPSKSSRHVIWSKSLSDLQMTDVQISSASPWTQLVLVFLPGYGALAGTGYPRAQQGKSDESAQTQLLLFFCTIFCFSWIK